MCPKKGRIRLPNRPTDIDNVYRAAKYAAKALDLFDPATWCIGRLTVVL